jgi:N-acetyl sugar amidotransferase
MINSNYQICTRCVIDTSDPGVTFNVQGLCNFCIEHEFLKSKYTFTEKQENKNLLSMGKMIKNSKKSNTYDCIIGLSGGVDSSYVALLAKKLGLNPLCVHFDNGWNTELSVSNIRKIVEYCNFELYTYVINWEEFRDLQRSFIKADVVDLEMLSDHAIFAALFAIRKKFRIKIVLSGTNFNTEYGLPDSWIWSKMDFRNIKDIHKKYGEVKLKTYPKMNNLKWSLIRQFGFGGTFLEPLNMINYKKNIAMNALSDIGWQYYGGKHFESIITKFYQGYILPVKFGIDKRRCHHSSLIRNMEMSRSAALEDLKLPALNDETIQSEKKYICKKLGFSIDEFDEIMRRPEKKHYEYKTDMHYMNIIKKIAKLVLKRKEHN